MTIPLNSALIGYTGFVGSNIHRQIPHKYLFNQSNIDESKDRHFDILTVSAAPAEKWRANKFPEQDLLSIESLKKSLNHVTADHVVLISTVDVYPNPTAVYENTEIIEENSHPYGLHRRLLEQFVEERYDYTIIRLPGLFGEGLKKNVVFDFLNSNNIGQIDSRHEFQFYNLDYIGKDIQHFVDAKINLVNLATEPVSVLEVQKACTGATVENHVSPNIIRYDFRSNYAENGKDSNGYFYSKSETIEDLTDFAKRYSNAS